MNSGVLVPVIVVTDYAICYGQDRKDVSEVHLGSYPGNAVLAQPADRLRICFELGHTFDSSQRFPGSESFLLPAGGPANRAGSVCGGESPCHAVRHAAPMLRQAEARKPVDHSG